MVTGIICIADKNKKSPIKIKKDAKKRYVARLFSFIAKTAQKAPIITNKKDCNIENPEIPLIDPKRKPIPRIINSRPAKKTICAVVLRT